MMCWIVLLTTYTKLRLTTDSATGQSRRWRNPFSPLNIHACYCAPATSLRVGISSLAARTYSSQGQKDAEIPPASILWYTANLWGPSITPRNVDFPIRMVHDCEERFIASELHRKCLMFRQFNTTDIKNLVPVVSEGSGIVYVNRFCAECSGPGIEHYQTCRTEFICWNRLLQHNQWELLALEWNKENRVKLIEVGMCNYVFHAPRPVKMENNRCMDFRYTSCNETGQWEVNDPFLEEACGAYELPYQDFYKNYHCMMCNTPLRYSSPENRHRINPLCNQENMSV